MAAITTGTDNATVYIRKRRWDIPTVKGDYNTEYISEGEWKDGKVWVSSHWFCSIPGHSLEVMHHYDDDGTHFCPTGFLWCPDCAGVAEEPEPYECERWGC